jgi:hypothetical protein
MIFFALFPAFLSALRGYQLLTAKFAQVIATFAKKINPRVLVETPAPPVLREERIGKEMLAGIAPPASFPRCNRLSRP